MSPKEAFEQIKGIDIIIDKRAYHYTDTEYKEAFECVDSALDRLEEIEKRVKYIFHGTNAKLLDDGLVAGTYFTDDLEIALKYGKTVYAIDLTRYNEHFVLNEEGHYVSHGFIPLDVMYILTGEEEPK